MSVALRSAVAGAVVAGVIAAPSAFSSDPAPGQSNVPAASLAANQRFGSSRRAPAAQVGNDRATAQRLRAAAGGDRAFDVREVRAAQPQIHLGVGEQVLCLSTTEVSGTGSTSCTETATAAAGDKPLVALDFIGDGRYRVTGVFPDGIAAVTVRSSGGAARVAVDSNVVTTIVSSLPVSLAWDGLAGEPNAMTLRG